MNRLNMRQSLAYDRPGFAGFFFANMKILAAKVLTIYRSLAKLCFMVAADTAC